MPTLEFKAKVDGSQIDVFARKAKSQLREIGHEGHLVGRILGEHVVGKFAKLAAVGVSGGLGIGTAITVAVAGLEHLNKSVEQSTEELKKHVELIEKIALEYGITKDAAEDYYNFVAQNIPKKPGESNKDYEKRAGSAVEPSLKSIEEAIKEALKPEHASRREHFDALGVNDQMLGTPGNADKIARILQSKVNQPGGYEHILGATGGSTLAKQLLPSIKANADAYSEKTKYSYFNGPGPQGPKPEGPTGMTDAEREALATTATLQDRVNAAKEKTNEIEAEHIDKEDRLNKLLFEQGELEQRIYEEGMSDRTLIDQEKLEKLKQKIIPLLKEINDKRKKDDEEKKDKQDRAQFNLDKETREKANQMIAHEFNARATGRALVGGFGGTGRNVEVGDKIEVTNQLLGLIHNVLLNNYKQNTFSKDIFNLH